MDYVKLEELEIYQLAMEIGEEVWCIVQGWSSLANKTTGAQFIDAADSIAANIAEGYGRYFYKDRKNFCYYSRGSLFETKTWTQKSFRRSLITQAQYDQLMERLKTLHFKLNVYIKKLKTNAET